MIVEMLIQETLKRTAIGIERGIRREKAKKKEEEAMRAEEEYKKEERRKAGYTEEDNEGLSLDHLIVLSPFILMLGILCLTFLICIFWLVKINRCGV